jgi:YceI-like domain
MKTILLARLSAMTIATFYFLPIFAQNFVISSESQQFAVITQKEGIASTLAHDHLIRATNVQADITVPEGNILKGKFKVTMPTKDLMMDDPGSQTEMFPKLKSLEIQKKAFSALSESDRKKIKSNMEDASQLDVAQFDTISAEVMEVETGVSEVGTEKFTHSVKVKVTIKGKEVTKTLPAKITLENGTLSVLSFGKFKFTDFGIKPYSALFGAIRNSDPFTLFVSFEAKPKS